MSTTGPDGSDPTAEFVRLLQQHERRTSAYVHSLVPHWADAEDLLQETSVRLWEQFAKYEPGSDFGAWACTVARFMVLAYRERRQRDRLVFSRDLIELVSREIDDAAQAADRRLPILRQCLGKLNDRSRALVRLCYGQKLTAEQIGEEQGRSANAVHQAISRIRRKLQDCVEAGLAAGEQP